MKFKKLNEELNVKEDKFVLYFPYLEPKIISKEKAIKQLEFELNYLKTNSGASLAGRGFGLYCLESYDEETGTTWSGRYNSKEFIKVISEEIDSNLTEDLEDERDLLFAASDYKCKLSSYDIEEAYDWKVLLSDIKHVYSILHARFGDELKVWSYYEDDEIDFGYKVILKNGEKHIVEINNDTVDIVTESLTEDSATQFIIVAVTKNGTRVFYNAVDDNFVTSAKDATIYDEHDVAIDDWHKLDKSQFKRVFVPNYDPALFESCVAEDLTTYKLEDSELTVSKDSHEEDGKKVSTVLWSNVRNGKEIDSFSGTRVTDSDALNEGTGADTKTAAADIMNILAKDDNKKWAQTASDIINVIPDDFADDLIDAVKKKVGEFRLSAENKKKIAEATNGNLTEGDLADTDTVGKVLELFDTFEWAKKNPGLIKGIVMVILSIVAIIEPTPVVDVITIIIGVLPADIVAKIMAFISTLNNPLGHIANQLHKKNESLDEEFCCICNEPVVGYGNNAEPVCSGRCCDRCNFEKVIPARLAMLNNSEKEYETDYRYYVYKNDDDVVGDEFEYDEDAIEWAKENGYPIVKIHNYYRDERGKLQPDGYPEVIWTAK